MNNESMVKLSIHYGTVELVNAHKVIDNDIWLGGYSIVRDRNGVELSRTEPTYHTRVYVA